MRGTNLTFDESIPLADASVDLITAHWVFEHIEKPDQLVSEYVRILKPGGWICARTPHRWSYVGIAACLTPQRVQVALLRLIRPGIDARDKFPTLYRLNTLQALNKYFSNSHWLNYSYGINPTPRYYFEKRWTFSVLSAYHAIAWPKTDIIVLLQKEIRTVMAPSGLV